MKIKATDKLLERMLNHKMNFSDIKKTRYGSKAKFKCTSIKLKIESQNLFTFEFFHGRSHLASLGPVQGDVGGSITIKGLEVIIPIDIN